MPAIIIGKKEKEAPYEVLMKKITFNCFTVSLIKKLRLNIVIFFCLIFSMVEGNKFILYNASYKMLELLIECFGGL